MKREGSVKEIMFNAFPISQSLIFVQHRRRGAIPAVKNPCPCMTRCKENSDLYHDKEVR